VLHMTVQNTTTIIIIIIIISLVCLGRFGLF
jgi:hypothetical protein